MPSSEFDPEFVAQGKFEAQPPTDPLAGWKLACRTIVSLAVVAGLTVVGVSNPELVKTVGGAALLLVFILISLVLM